MKTFGFDNRGNLIYSGPRDPGFIDHTKGQRNDRHRKVQRVPHEEPTRLQDSCRKVQAASPSQPSSKDRHRDVVGKHEMGLHAFD